MDRKTIYGKIKQEAISQAETDLKAMLWSEAYEGQIKETLNPDWHPYYMRVAQTAEGLKFSLVVRDGEVEFFRRKKLPQPDWQTPAIAAMEAALTKYKHELLTLELVEAFNKTDGVKAEWHPDQNQ